MNDNHSYKDGDEEVFDIQVTMHIKCCGDCGIIFGVLANIWNEARRKRRDVFCSNGHRLVPGEDLIEEERKREHQRLARRTAVAEAGKAHLVDQVDAYQRDRSQSAVVPMLFCRTADPKAPRSVRPCWPFTGDGQLLSADGETYLTLAQAEAIGGESMPDLRERFRACFPALFEPTEADEGKEGRHGE